MARPPALPAALRSDLAERREAARSAARERVAIQAAVDLRVAESRRRLAETASLLRRIRSPSAG